MHPASTSALSSSVATVTFSSSAPDWSARNKLIRWDTAGAFSHSLDPQPFGTLYSATLGADYTRAWAGAEYHVNSASWKNADISFTVTGKKFAIRYLTIKDSDAMVWIDGVPAADEPFAGTDPAGTGTWNWLVINRSSSDAAEVRFAGPVTFTGVDFDSNEDVTVKATNRFTLGVISDSIFENLGVIDPKTQSPAPLLSTLTGFRVWNMAEGGTGYINDGTGTALSGGLGVGDYRTSPFGSDRRIASIAAAPLDALLVNGTINDLDWSAAEHREAMDAFLSRVAAVRPDLPVVLVSIEPLSYNGFHDQSDPRFKALNDNFAEVAARHSNVVGVIDPYTADWLTGTGSSSNPKGDGNQDQYVSSDGVHFNAAGQAYFQQRIVEELRAFKARLNTSD